MDTQSEKSIGEDATLAGRGKPSASARDVSIGDERTLTGDLAIQETLLDDIEIVDLEARYTVEAELGEGGMGAVVLATDTRLGRKVAIKRILGDPARSKAAVARFLTEARAIAAMSHPNVVQIYELGVAKSGPFLVIEYIDGGSLLDRCKAGPIPAGEAVSVVCQVCDGLAKAHDAGIIHRDIKPANILLTKDGIPKLTDFGLAKAEAADHQMTMTGAVMGTPDFMPPEQRRDAALVDHRSDLWSLAATLYQMVSGRSPKVIRLHELPQEMQPILAKALEDEKDARYQSAKELREALRAIQVGTQKPAVPAAFEADLQEGQCKACGTVTSDLTKKFCRNPKCGASLRVSCLACNAQIPIWDGVCGECGGNQPSLLEEKRKSVTAKKAEAEAFLSDLAFDEAMAHVEELAAESRVELSDLAEWAQEFIRSTRVERDRQYAVASEHLEDAKKHAAAFDYAAALQAIETIPERLRNAEASAFRSDCKARHEEVGGLIPEIAARISRKQVDGLLSLVERATELRGDRQDLVKIRQQLRERRDGRLARVKAKLEAGDVISAGGILDRTDPSDLGPVGEELNKRVRNILALEAKLSALCKEAKSDGVVTSDEAKCILDVCEAYLVLNPKNEEIRRLESTCRQKVAKSAPPPTPAIPTAASPERRANLPTTTAGKIAWCRVHDSKSLRGRAQDAAKNAGADALRDAAAESIKTFFGTSSNPGWRRRNAAQMSAVQKRVIEVVASQLGVSHDQITPETQFIADLGADSLDAVVLVMELEEAFEINIPDEVAEKIRTVGQVVAYLEAHIG